MSPLHSSPVPPLEDEDLLQEILLRLPPLPSSLPRASVVCKRWNNILTDHRFLYRFRKHHRKPPLIGFFDKEVGRAPVFTPVLDPPNRIPVSFAVPKNLLDCTAWANQIIHVSFSFFGCRHGIALFLNRPRHEAVLWDPYTNFQHRVAYPSGFDNPQVNVIGFDNQQDNIIRSAAVLCSVGDQQHVHGDCHLSPFKLVLACHDAKCTKAFVCIYESKSGVWEDSISIATTDVISRNRPSILVRNALCWLLHGGGILEFDFERLTLDVIEKPASVNVTNTFGVDWSFQIIRGEDNGLGLAVLPKPDELSIQLWARKSDCDGVVSWVLQKTVQLDELFTRPICSGMGKLVLMPGYDEDTNVIFLSSVSHDFMLQLESMKFKYIGRREYQISRIYYPYANFYTAGRRQYQSSRTNAAGDGGAENVNG